MDVVPVTRRHWRSFFINLSLVVLVAVSGLYTGLALSTGQTIDDEINTRARSIFGAVRLARHRDAVHGGTYLERRPGVAPSPFLRDRAGRRAAGAASPGPAGEVMERALPDLAGPDGSFTYRFTSLRPTSPSNAPDAFEAEALARLEGGAPEAFTREVRGDARLHRYLGPLYVEESCLACHAGKDEKVGALRGGVSVTFDVTEAEQAVARARWIAVGLFTFTTAALLLVLGRLVASLHRRLNAAEARIVELAITDELTGLPNRRFIEQRLGEELVRSQRHDRRCACILLDIDLFKLTNDTWGHAAGDAVLRGLASAARGALRESDLLGRWGGEEFLAVLPETDLSGAVAMAERLRRAIEAMRVEHEGRQLTATVSLGVADALPGEDPDARDADRLVARADLALYRAKAAGRNRIDVG
jgi:diguanylate cyclase (GGDEF)-like protein